MVTVITAVPSVQYALYFEFSVLVTSLCFISASVVNFVFAIWVVPKVCKRWCIARCISIGLMIAP